MHIAMSLTAIQRSQSAIINGYDASKGNTKVTATVYTVKVSSLQSLMAMSLQSWHGKVWTHSRGSFCQHLSSWQSTSATTPNHLWVRASPKSVVSPTKSIEARRYNIIPCQERCKAHPPIPHVIQYCMDNRIANRLATARTTDEIFRNFRDGSQWS
jgi:hypothetical protein